jgi:chaperone required for assembly of F1-ATPase
MILQKKKSWKSVRISRVVNSTYEILLDKVRLKTEREVSIQVPKKLALSVSREWRAHEDITQIKKKFHTSFCFSVFDNTLIHKKKMLQTMLEYADCDLICYLADKPSALVNKQTKNFLPFIKLAESFFSINLNLGKGVLHIKQNSKNQRKIMAYLEKLSVFEITLLYELTNLTGSFFISTALVRGICRPTDAWRASNIEDSYRIKIWGSVEEESQLIEARRKLFYSLVKLRDKIH